MIKDVLHSLFGISDLQMHLIFMLENLLTACTAAVYDRKMFKVVQKSILSTLFVILFLKKEKKQGIYDRFRPCSRDSSGGRKKGKGSVFFRLMSPLSKDETRRGCSPVQFL